MKRVRQEIHPRGRDGPRTSPVRQPGAVRESYRRPSGMAE